MSNFSILRDKFLNHDFRIKNISIPKDGFIGVVVEPFVTKSNIPLYHEVDSEPYIIDIPFGEKVGTPVRKSEYFQPLRIRTIASPTR